MVVESKNKDGLQSIVVHDQISWGLKLKFEEGQAR